MWRSTRCTDRRWRQALAFGLALVLVGPAVASGSADPHAGHGGHADHAGHGPTGAGYARAEARYAIPDVRLVDQAGASVGLHEELSVDGPVMLQFIFTTCTTVCPVLTATAAAAERQLVDEGEVRPVRVLSITIDPEHDTPARLAAYAARFGVADRWRFLTGSRVDVETVLKAFDAYRGNKMRHEPLTFLRRTTGEPWMRLDGFLSATQLAEEMRQVVGP